MKRITLERAVLFSIVLVGLVIIWPFVTALLLAVITTYIIFPFIKKLKNIVGSRGLAIFISVMLILFLVLALFYYLIHDITLIAKEISKMELSMNIIFTKIYSALDSVGLGTVAENSQTIIATLIAYFQSQFTNVAKMLPKIALDITIYLFATYYLLKEGNTIKTKVFDYIKKMPVEERKLLSHIVSGIKNSLDVLIWGYVGMGAICGIIAYIGFLIFRIPYAALFAILVGIFAFLPIFGAWMIYGGIAVYMLWMGDPTSAFAIMIYGVLFINFIPDVVIRPLLGARIGKVHPLTILLGFFGGPLVFGIKGFLLGPILLVIAETVLMSYFYNKNNK